jgi:hypothetical protein
MLNKQDPLIFTPDDEPYLGRDSLRTFDELIVVCMKSNLLAAAHTHCIEKTDLQMAACHLIPSGLSLTLSIRELVRQGYLYGALVLMRSLAERATILSYLYLFPEAVAIWKRGWKYKERPLFKDMLDRIAGKHLPKIGATLTGPLNSLTHGDPESAAWNLIETDKGGMGYAASKILNRPDLCDHVCRQAIGHMASLKRLMHLIFPDAFGTKQDEA